LEAVSKIEDKRLDAFEDEDCRELISEEAWDEAADDLLPCEESDLEPES
jgi:hypothetical protein